MVKARLEWAGMQQEFIFAEKDWEPARTHLPTPSKGCSSEQFVECYHQTTWNEREVQTHFHTTSFPKNGKPSSVKLQPSPNSWLVSPVKGKAGRGSTCPALG